MGEWGEKVEWDAKNLKVTNLAALKTPHVAEEPGDSHTQGDPLADSSPKPSKPPEPPSGGGMNGGDPLAG